MIFVTTGRCSFVAARWPRCSSPSPNQAVGASYAYVSSSSTTTLLLLLCFFFYIITCASEETLPAGIRTSISKSLQRKYYVIITLHVCTIIACSVSRVCESMEDKKKESTNCWNEEYKMYTTLHTYRIDSFLYTFGAGCCNVTIQRLCPCIYMYTIYIHIPCYYYYYYIRLLLCAVVYHQSKLAMLIYISSIYSRWLVAVRSASLYIF